MITINIDSNDLYNFLKEKGYNYLYHSNTVQTACTFIENNGLLSRGAVENKHLVQTPQDSDDLDKTFDVWDDIFLDILDLHGYFPRQNLYGPVLFKFKIEILNNLNLPDIWITKDNPIYWNESFNDSDKYYQDLNGYKNDFDYNVANSTIQKKMITLRKTLDPLMFRPYLEEILLDNPKKSIGAVNLYDTAKSSLITSLQSAGINATILNTRQCNFNCFCHENYSGYTNKYLKKLFLLV